MDSVENYTDSWAITEEGSRYVLCFQGEDVWRGSPDDLYQLKSLLVYLTMDTEQDQLTDLLKRFFN